MTEEIRKSHVVAEGKTKQLYAIAGTGSRMLVVVHSKDDITAGDGQKHDILPGKGAWSTQTTCNVFELLKKCGIDVAHERRLGLDEFLAPLVEMLPFEAVCRRKAMGSYCERNPHVPKGHVFPRLVSELYLKTHGRKWIGVESGKEYTFPANVMKLNGVDEASYDDPLMKIVGDKVELYNAHLPLAMQKPFLTLPFNEILPFENFANILAYLEEMTRTIFLILEKAWAILDRDFVDYKAECGFPSVAWLTKSVLDSRKIMLADVLDADSWRTLYRGVHEDKQYYREGGDLAKLAEKYAAAAALTEQFRIPRQQIVVWTGSPDDKIEKFEGALAPFNDIISVSKVCISGHKNPVLANSALNKLLGEIPDSVIIAFVGMSNGLGPTLAPNCTAPVINVPVNAPDTDKPFADDVWSSLRMPSQNPAMTVLNPKNAVLAALQILASRNPHLYALLRYEQEKRFTNVVPI